MGSWEYDGNISPFVTICLILFFYVAAAWRWFSATTATRGSSYVQSSAMWGWLTQRPSVQKYIHNNPHNIAIDRLQESSSNGMFSWIYHMHIIYVITYPLVICSAMENRKEHIQLNRPLSTIPLVYWRVHHNISKSAFVWKYGTPIRL